MISVIIPVYNSQEYLERCVNSVLAQTYKDFEVILVDDNSLDDSLSVCVEYQKKDSRVKVIHSETSEGASGARNIGLEAAQGDLVVFIDSDDWVEADQFEFFAKHITDGVDVVIHNYTIEENGNVKNALEIPFQGEKWCTKDIAAVIAWLDRTGKFNYLWNRAYKRSIIEKYKIRFEKQFVTGQDLDFNCKYFRYVTAACVSNACMYHYMKYGTGTLCAKYKRNLYEIVTELNSRRKSLYEYYGMFDSDEYRAIYAHTQVSYLMTCVPNMYRQNAPYNNRDRVALMRQIFSNDELKECIQLFKPRSRIDRIFFFLYKVQSPKLAVLAYSVLFSIRNNHQDAYKKLKGSPMKKTAPVTVMIPTMNRPESLKETVEGYLNADVVPQEIIVVDQSSNEDAKDENKKFINSFFGWGGRP